MGRAPCARHSDQIPMPQLRARERWAGTESGSSVLCPTCKSSDLKKLSLIYAAGMHESQGRIHRWLLADERLLLGRYQGTNQNRLSKIARPPVRPPFVSPVILWFVGLFVVMAFVGGGRASWMVGFLAAAYVLSLPAYFLVAVSYCFFVRPKKHRRWDGMFMCGRCGALVGPHTHAWGTKATDVCSSGRGFCF